MSTLLQQVSDLENEVLKGRKVKTDLEKALCELLGLPWDTAGGSTSISDSLELLKTKLTQVEVEKPKMTDDSPMARHKATELGVRLGQLIPDQTEARRDATHVAVAPVTAARQCKPGEPVQMDSNGEVRPTNWDYYPVGIIDPFLREPVEEGQSCWLLVMPGTITSLIHYWEHPSFWMDQGQLGHESDPSCRGCD